MSINDIQNMSQEEKIYLMEQLWNNLTQNENNIESPNWHKTILDERIKKYQNNELKTFTLDEIKDSLKNETL